MIRKTVAICLGLTLASAVAADESSPTVNIKRLTQESALMIAQGAMEACRQEGIQIGVAVVDRNGIPQVVLRDTLAAPITAEIGLQKAVTAVNFNVATSQLVSRANTPIGRVKGLVMSAGGLPVQAGGSLLGGVGVSGAPSGETDEACAQAGIDKIQDDLEMAL